MPSLLGRRLPPALAALAICTLMPPLLVHSGVVTASSSDDLDLDIPLDANPIADAALFSRESLEPAHPLRHARAPPKHPSNRPWPGMMPALLPAEPFAPNISEMGMNAPFTPFHMATNVPAFMMKRQAVWQSLPRLAEAGSLVWRWPGGAIADAWCPTTSEDTYEDECFERYPLLKGMGFYPTSDSLLDLASFIRVCAKHKCIPVLQLNAVVSMVYGTDACVDLTARILRDFHRAGIDVQHLEFGNELYALWSPAAQQSWAAVQYTPSTYATNYTDVRAKLRQTFPDRPLYLGLMMTDHEPDNGVAPGSGWNNAIVTSGVAADADWITLHKYFTTFLEWVESSEASSDTDLLGSLDKNLVDMMHIQDRVMPTAEPAHRRSLVLVRRQGAVPQRNDAPPPALGSPPPSHPPVIIVAKEDEAKTAAAAAEAAKHQLEKDAQVAAAATVEREAMLTKLKEKELKQKELKETEVSSMKLKSALVSIPPPLASVNKDARLPPVLRPVASPSFALDVDDDAHLETNATLDRFDDATALAAAARRLLVDDPSDEDIPRAWAPPIGLSEYNLISIRSGACGGGQQYIALLFQTKLLGETVRRGEGRYGLNAFYAHMGAPKDCSNRRWDGAAQAWVSGFQRAKSDFLGLLADPWGVSALPAGMPTPSWYGMWVWSRYGGEALIAASSHDASVYNRVDAKVRGAHLQTHLMELSVYVTRFALDEGAPEGSDAPLGVIIINESPHARAVELRDSGGDGWRSDAAWLNDAKRVRLAGHILEPDWVREDEAHATSDDAERASYIAAHPTYANGVRINGERSRLGTKGDGQRPGVSGPLPPADVHPYATVLVAGSDAFEYGTLRLHVPAYGILAAVLRNADAEPIEPPNPPPPLPPPPPLVPVQSVWVLLSSRTANAVEWVNAKMDRAPLPVAIGLLVAVAIGGLVVGVACVTMAMRVCGRRTVSTRPKHTKDEAPPTKESGEGEAPPPTSTKRGMATVRQRVTRESRGSRELDRMEGARDDVQEEHDL